MRQLLSLGCDSEQVMKSNGNNGIFTFAFYRRDLQGTHERGIGNMTVIVMNSLFLASERERPA